MHKTTASVITVLGFLPVYVSAYTWSFKDTPKQCSNVTISIQGQGNPPYRILVIPFGPSPLPNNVEARTILNQPFDGSSTSLTFPLKYPANSQLVAVISDASGFGSGGTSAAATVLSSSDSSCFDGSKSVQPAFVYNINPPNQLVQCSATRIWWDPNTVQGNPKFFGVIPGGQSFSVPQGSVSTVAQQGTGFSWTPSVRGGTTLLLVGGDDRGAGSAGSVLFTVGSGLDPSTSCLNSNSPSSTAGSPAGGSYPTSSSGASTGGGGGSGGSKTNVGAIVGGVVGGIVLLVALGLLLLFFYRRRRFHASQKEKPVDLFMGGDEGDHSDLPQNYAPEPFMDDHPATTFDGHTEAGASANENMRPLSGVTSTSRSGTPDIYAASSAATRKTAQGPKLRPVNIIQHDDAGPSEPRMSGGDDEPETVELPPAYTNIRK